MVQSLQYFGLLKDVTSGDLASLIKFFEEDQRLVEVFQAIGDTGYEAATRAIADARLSREPRREVESAITLLRQTHVAYTKALDVVPPSGDPELSGYRDYVWAFKRSLRNLGDQERGRWAKDAEHALAVCRVSALIG